ncbi:MAG: thiolase family protein [Candidatus Nezhaarchaeota archaeon]|nr:thiolase family protein [Candidatus Nezhaarchaeota archaeon]
MRPAIIGYGRTKFGEHYEGGPEDLIGEAGLKALDSAGLERRDIEYCFLSDYFLQLTNKIGIEEGFMSELLELHVPMERCRSFSSALFNAYYSIMAGRCEVALVGGVEKLTDRLEKIRDDLMMLEDPWSYYAGGCPEANHELMLRFYVREHGLSKVEEDKLLEALALIAVKNHSWASLNKDAHFYGKTVSLKEVLEARQREARMLGLYDFAPISDGASAIILASPDKARKLCDSPVYVRGFYSATDFISYSCRKEKTGFLAAKIAVQRALSMAKLDVSDVAVAELYDQSTLMELIALEDVGLYPRGRAWRGVLESLGKGGMVYSVRGRELFVNTSGGRKADGNPLGASGGAMIIELARQLRGEAGPRQVPLSGRATAALMMEMEGFGTKVYAHVLSKEPH